MKLLGLLEVLSQREYHDLVIGHHRIFKPIPSNLNLQPDDFNLQLGCKI